MPNEIAVKDEKSGPTPNMETLAYLLELAHGAPAAQVQQSEKLDGKTVNAFGAATVILGLLASARPDIHASHHQLIAATIAYLVAAGATLSSLWVRHLQVIDDPRALWATLYDENVDNARWAVMDSLVTGYGKNVRTMFWKKVTLSVALLAAGFEVLVIAYVALF